MIQYKDDGITLADSTGRTVGPRDEEYYSFLMIKSAQDAAAGENNAAAVDYHTKLGNFQGAIDAGRAVGLSSPAKPMMKLVADNGSVTMVPFVPALPDPVYPVISPSGSIKSAPAPDRTDVLLNLVMTLLAKVDKLTALVASK